MNERVKGMWQKVRPIVYLGFLIVIGIGVLWALSGLSTKTVNPEPVVVEKVVTKEIEVAKVIPVEKNVYVTATPLPPTPTSEVDYAAAQLADLTNKINESWKMRDWQNVIDLIQQIRRIDSGKFREEHHVAYLEWGKDLVSGGDLKAAKEKLTRACEIMPWGAEAIQLLGDVSEQFNLANKDEICKRVWEFYGIDCEASRYDKCWRSNDIDRCMYYME